MVTVTAGTPAFGEPVLFSTTPKVGGNYPLSAAKVGWKNTKTSWIEHGISIWMHMMFIHCNIIM